MTTAGGLALPVKCSPGLQLRDSAGLSPASPIKPLASGRRGTAVKRIQLHKSITQGAENVKKTQGNASKGRLPLPSDLGPRQVRRILRWKGPYLLGTQNGIKGKDSSLRG